MKYQKLKNPALERLMQESHPELIAFSILKNVIAGCEESMAQFRPEIVLGYPESNYGLNEPYMHAGKMVLNDLESLKSSLELYRDIILSKEKSGENFKVFRSDPIPF